MSSKTDIANMALARFGQSRITDFNENSASAIACGVEWDNAYKAALRQADWNFALDQAELAQSLPKPLFRWNFAYQLPSNYIRLVECNCVKAGTHQVPWVVQGGKILSNESRCQIVYVKDVWQTDLWDASFVEFFSWMLASLVAPRLMSSGADVAVTLARQAMDSAILAMFPNHIETRPKVKTALEGSQYIAARCWGDGDWYPRPGTIGLEYDVTFNPHNVGP